MTKIETAILGHALEHPCRGSTRVEQELRFKGIQVSFGGDRSVWQRHNLLTKHERLPKLEKAAGEPKIQLKEGWRAFAHRLPDHLQPRI